MSALDGTLEAGDVVWQQMYSPTDPSWQATLAERIEGGVTYMPRRKMRLVRVFRDGIDGRCPNADENGMHPLSGAPLPAHTEHYHCVDVENGDPSWTDNNWCVLEHAELEDALW